MNYFLREITTTNRSANASPTRLVAGREGAKAYHFNLNALTYTYDSPDSRRPNPLLAAGEGFYAIVSQFLNMGLADVEPGTVSWKGNDFSGLRDGGLPVYGHLETSNGLPRTLAISASRGGSSFKSFSYIYPDPPTALDGFPSRTIVSVLFEDGLHPFLELTILDIKRAKQRLFETFFSETRFLATNVVYTNFFSNGVFMAILPGGKVVKAPTPINQVKMEHLPGVHKAIVIVCFCSTTVAFLSLSLRFGKTAK